MVKAITISVWSADCRENVCSMDPRQVERCSSFFDPADAQGTARPIRIPHREDIPDTSTAWRRRAATAAIGLFQNERRSARRSVRPVNLLLKRLKDRREKFAKSSRWELYQVALNFVLEEIARERPHPIPDLLEVKGLGKNRIDKFGKAFSNSVILHERQEVASSHIENGQQPAAVGS